MAAEVALTAVEDTATAAEMVAASAAAVKLALAG